MSTLLEVTWAAHVDVERLERLIVKDFQHEPPLKRQRLFQNHRVHNMINSITTTTKKLIEIYEDKDNAWRDEIAVLDGQTTASGTNPNRAFYERLKEIGDSHRRNPNSMVIDAFEYDELLLKEEPIVEFSGEEKRLFLTKHTPVAQLNRKYFAKGSRTVGSRIGAAAAPEQTGLKETALKEVKMKRLCELLNETILQIKEYIEKKQALTNEEMEAEREDEEVEADTESDKEEQQINNPLKLPMGFDGKPIPYWLYELHGLVQEFKCEICGNHSYLGRRAFEWHFKEGRHQYGMDGLGIPSTKIFNEVT
ncbi:Splicing factor SF3a60 binding domain [Macleaya cordata]|uniref:Splicing factor SF3a60 binding domain n=1 Tax=Macleaya cordata TaxID=56857 RepID=A0A200R0P5_MACCD|nr:Splicing factor SF3a60 binding domain [Macleaya cordata]